MTRIKKEDGKPALSASTASLNATRILARDDGEPAADCPGFLAPPAPDRPLGNPGPRSLTKGGNPPRLFDSSRSARTLMATGPRWGGPLRSDDARHPGEDTRR